jgi:hypothetical protein
MCRCRLSLVKLCHLVGCGVDKGVRLKGDEASSFWETGKSIFNMGPEWSEVCTVQVRDLCI